MKNIIKLSVLGSILFPVFAYAQLIPSQTTNVFSILGTISNIFKVLIPILITLATVWFIWGVIEYVVGGDEEAKKKGKDKMIYGIIGLVVIVSVWGIVALLTNTFGVQTGFVPGTTTCLDRYGSALPIEINGWCCPTGSTFVSNACSAL